MKGIIYARYSSDSQREESIEGQLRECKEYAERQGITILSTYIDRALSAKTDNRPEFQRMVRDSANGLFDVVIVWKLDRFARNRYDSAHYKNLLKKNGVKVVSAQEAPAEDAKKPEDLTLVLMVKRADEPWFQAEAKGFEDKCKELGVRGVIMDNKMDPNTHLTNLDNAIAQKVSGMAVVVPDQGMSQTTVDKAKAAGISVVAVDDTLIDANGKSIAPYIGLENSQIGYQVGEWLAGQVNTAGWMKDPSKKVGVAAMTFDEVEGIKLRTDGCKKAILEKMQGATEDMIFEMNYKNTDAVGSQEAMQSLLTQHPDITNWVIYAGNDEGVVGAVRALEQVKKDKDSIGCGLGAGLAAGEFAKEGGTAFKASAFISSYNHGVLAAQALYDNLVNGVEIPENTSSSGTIITVENYKEVMGL